MASELPGLQITEALVQRLIQDQFPAWGHLSIKAVEFNGIDNRTFRLGDQMSIRLPRAERYAMQVPKEQKWLPLLAPHLPLPIPTVIAMGRPSKDYPWNWSVYKWLDGSSANSIDFDEKYLDDIAQHLGQFLTEFHKFNADEAPELSLHNWWRAAHTSTYDQEARSLIGNLKDIIDVNRATSLWENAISSWWSKDPVWVHGDISSGNILVQSNKLNAVIDFGCMGIGDPACDLTIAWTFFKNESRKIFKSTMGLDPDTWRRARGWTLWKALYELSKLDDKLSVKALIQKQIIDDILEEHEFEAN